MGAAGGATAAPAAKALQQSPEALEAQSRVRLVRTGLRLLRSLANSDPNKIKMGTGPTLTLLITALVTFKEAPSVLEQAAAGISSLCLRIVDNAARATERGALPLLAAAMRKHPTAAGLQRSCCLALRNLVVKSPSRVQAAFDEGACWQAWPAPPFWGRPTPPLSHPLSQHHGTPHMHCRV